MVQGRPRRAICYYSLGLTLFPRPLPRLGGTKLSGQAYRALYLRHQQDDRTDGCGGPRLNICRIASVFKDNASADVVRKVDEVIARWYGPLP